MAESKIDYKKTDKNLYIPKQKPMIVDVPEMLFLMHNGTGDPNSTSYQNAVGAMYAIAYTISMSAKKGDEPEGFFPYVVPPLEGLWWTEGDFDLDYRDNWLWTSMIRQPEFVNENVLLWAKESCAKKKPEIDTSAVRLETFHEGLCVQMMHIGPYATEPASVQQMHGFLQEEGYRDETANIRKHHEIYLSDPRKTAPAKLKTVLRHPIAKI